MSPCGLMHINARSIFIRKIFWLLLKSFILYFALFYYFLFSFFIFIFFLHFVCLLCFIFHFLFISFFKWTFCVVSLFFVSFVLRSSLVYLSMMYQSLLPCLYFESVRIRMSRTCGMFFFFLSWFIFEKFFIHLF